ncbi:NAD(P)/FAD-dependent oxidoreductase [Sphingobium sp. H39-3-25]|uniref:FAD-dependent oxidoreductase n=1 Tax=Sphingobium arseniciresistens TaxID=3030834 RepID=UPI0023B8F234|nr:NAD(P)/FAD-dependent oxidoreductase [Sphingobium arseniciresistens]
MRKVEALVVGAGPVGTIAASRLAAMNIDVMLCEAQSSCAHDLRASTFHASTLEMLDEIGAAAPLIARGLKAPVYHMRDRKSGEVIDFDLAEIADHTRFPFRLQCEQFHMANLLAQRMIDDPKIDMRFNARLVDAREVADGVIASVEIDGVLTEIHTRFLIGADGAHSVVRQKMDVEFEGFTYEEKFVSLSTALPIEDHVPNLSYVNYISDPDEWLVLLKVPTLWRVLVPADGRLSNEELISDENAAKVFSRIVGDVPVETEHRTIYRVHQRVAKSFVKGRMLLIGDAAHLNNPLGGFGMNSGIHDAWNLTEKLYSILRQDGDREQLDRFDRQRRTVTMNFIQAQTIENMAFMEQGAGEAGRLRRQRMAEIHADDGLRRDHLLKQAMFKSLEEAESIA